MLCVAKILKPQGLKGEVKCELFTDVLAVFVKSKKVFIDNKSFTISHASERQGFLYISFDEVLDRNQAEKLRGKEIKIDQREIDEITGGKLLVADLIGMKLYDEENQFVGEVVDYESFSSTPFLTILQDNHDYQMPFIEEIFIVKGKTVCVKREAFDRYKI